MTEVAATWDGHSADELAERWEHPVHTFASVESTNDEARRLAEEEDAPAGTIVIADQQTAGRGRGGRKWSSPAGAGVYLSMVFRPETLEPAPVSVLAGLGLARALDAAFPGLAPTIKWPNDLYADGLKFGGVLSEATWSDRRPRYLVVGVGVNVRPLGEGISQKIARQATSIDEELERSVPLVEVGDAVVLGLDRHLAAARPRLGSGDLADLDRYDGMRDRRGTLVPPGDKEPLPGKCVGIAPDGALLFRPDRGALQRVSDGSLIPESAR
ncbi:MAG: biotin--[acetyl-CoA-carboxylase] ligase [Gemmatimonadales bacterium]|jgi:BirA family biotin operon repressor/biotin-[acetyl-CoA-carboxylase] ligase